MTGETITRILQQMAAGEEAAEERLFSLLYNELRDRAGRMMRGAAGSTLQPTAVVHEAWLKLADGGADWRNRAHFLRVAAKTMRSILIDHARAKGTGKRGGGERLHLDEAVRMYEQRSIDLLALDDALENLAQHDPRLARLVELRFFGGLTIAETAEVLGVSTPTVERSWRSARSLLRTLLGDDDGED